MSTTKNIFVAGAAGRLGQLVITQLLHAGHQVTALIRGADTKHAATAEDLRARGVLVVEGDVHTPSSYEAALRGLDSVVSTLQGGPDVIIDGQRQLLDAAVRAGVPHFIPSDFAIDYFGIPDGTHALLDLRRAFANYLHTQPITYTHVLNGAFMEMLSDANYGFIDFEDHSLAYWGDGHQKLDFTTMEDTAKAVELAVRDEQYRNKSLEIAGDQINYHGFQSLLEELTGHPFSVKGLGSLTELETSIERKKATADSPYDYVMDQYNWAMNTGQAKLKHPLKASALGFTPTSVRTVLAELLHPPV